MRAQRRKYGILDDDGRVVRWVWDEPAPCYQFVVVKVKVVRPQRIDWAKAEPAPF